MKTPKASGSGLTDFACLLKAFHPTHVCMPGYVRKIIDIYAQLKELDAENPLLSHIDISFQGWGITYRDRKEFLRVFAGAEEATEENRERALANYHAQLEQEFCKADDRRTVRL
ncbi:MAG: hypothetical protein AB1512_02635 [Thermodesulfobacteriota bacterium]